MLYIIAGLGAFAGFVGASLVLFLWGLQQVVDNIGKAEVDDDET